MSVLDTVAHVDSVYCLRLAAGQEPGGQVNDDKRPVHEEGPWTGTTAIASVHMVLTLH